MAGFLALATLSACASAPEPAAPQPPTLKPVVLGVAPGGVFTINGEPVAKEYLTVRLRQIHDDHAEPPQIHLDADPGASYADVAHAMGAAMQAGFQRKLGVIGGT